MSWSCGEAVNPVTLGSQGQARERVEAAVNYGGISTKLSETQMMFMNFSV